ncbi:MAG: HpcH/HpaI aldolase family protein, partial [Burkholderiales bacterium]
VRGVAGASRATRYARVKDYFKKAHEELCVLVQAETREAVKNLDAMLDVEGIDGVFIGPNDLSADMGHLGNWQHPEVWKVMEDCARRIRKAGKAAGILVGAAEGKRCIDAGFTFIAVGADTGLLARGSEALAAQFKS